MSRPSRFDTGSRSPYRVWSVFTPNAKRPSPGRNGFARDGQQEGPVSTLHLLDNNVLSDTRLNFRRLALVVLCLLVWAPFAVYAPVVSLAFAFLPLLALSAASSAFSGWQASESQAQANQANRELAEYQYSKNLEMMNFQNAYNHPANQMKRYAQAGLNPNLIYGQGSAGNMTQLPQYHAPTMQPLPTIDFQGALSAFQDAQVKSAQVDNLREQRGAIEQNKLLAGVRTEIANKDLSFKDQTLINRVLGEEWKQEALWQKQHFGTPMAETQLEFMKGRNRQQVQQINKIVADTELTKLKNEWYSAQAIAKMGADLLGGLTKVGGMLSPAGRAFRAGKGALGSGTLGRYNSPSSWERMLRR